MNKKGLKVLEYNKIIELLKSQAGSVMAKERLGALVPSDDINVVRDGLAETSEAVTVIVRKGALPVGQLYDIEAALHFARKGGSLTMRQLLQVLYNLRVASNVVTFLKGDLPPLPIINAMAEVIVTFPRLASVSTDASFPRMKWPTALHLSLRASDVKSSVRTMPSETGSTTSSIRVPTGQFSRMPSSPCVTADM